VKKLYNNIIICVALLGVVILYVWGFVFYRTYLGCYMMPSTSIQLKEFSKNEFSVMSYNVKCDFRAKTQSDTENSWKNRAKIMSQLLLKYQPAIIGMQEVKRSQEYYFNHFFKNYNSVIKYRENKILAESNPIYFRADMFDLIKYESFWLSETPETQSVSWGALSHRIFTLIVLKTKKTNFEFLVANTHLDNSTDDIRSKQISVILSKIKQYNLPTLLMGDMNSGNYSNTITSIKQTLSDVGQGFYDEKMGTFNNFEYDGYCSKLDWIFCTKSNFIVNKYAVITDKINNKYPSDHFPIYSEIIQNM